MTISNNLPPGFNWDSFHPSFSSATDKLLKEHEKEVVEHLIKQIPDLKNKKNALELGCHLITQLKDSKHIDQISEAMAEVGAWPDSIWQRTGADHIAIVNIIKKIVTSVLPRSPSKERILTLSLNTAIRNGNKQAAIELLEHLPQIPSELSHIFNKGSALGAAIAHLPDPNFLKLVFHKENWDPERIKNLILEGNDWDHKVAITAYAISKSDPELLTFALSPKNNLLLHHACTLGDSKIVKTLLDLGFKTNQRDVNECTPIFYVKDTQTIDLLLNAGADINERPTGPTPLRNAIMFKRADSVISHFLDRGAKPFFRTFQAYLFQDTVNPHLAKRLVPDREECIKNGILHPKTIPYILEKYPGIELQLKRQVVPFLEVTHSPNDYKNLLETMELMNWGHDKIIDLVEKSEGDFLEYACKKPDVELAKWLIEFGASPSYKSLLLAERVGSQELIELHQGYINKPDEHGNTFIHFLIKNKGSLEDLKLLITLGADIEAKNNPGTALANACFFGNAQTREFLINSGADIKGALQTKVLKAMGNDLPDFLDVVLSKHPEYEGEVIAALKEGIPNTYCLHQTCESGNTRLVKIFLAAGFNANQRRTPDGFTPIFFAKDKQTIELLLAAGANINEPVGEYTPLRCAIEEDNPMVTYLLDHGATPQIRDLVEYMTHPGAKDPTLIKRLLPEKEFCSPDVLRRLLPYPETLLIIFKEYPDLEATLKPNIINSLNEHNINSLNEHNKRNICKAIPVMGWGDQHLVDFLQRHAGDFFIEACKESNTEIAKQLIALGAKPDSISYFEAVKINSPELMELHQEPRFKIPSTIYFTLLHRGSCSPADLMQLISLGFNIKEKTVLISACSLKNMPIIKTLIDLGADIKPALQAETLTKLQTDLPAFIDLVMQKDPNFKEELITAIQAIPDTSLNSGVLRAAIRLNLTDVVKRCIQQRTDFLREDSQGRSALDEMLAYEMDVVDIVNNIPEKERLKATKGVKRLVEAEVTKVSLSDLALALSVSKRRKILLGFKSLEFINGNLMTFFAKFSLQTMSFEERYDTWKRFSPTLQREYMSYLPSTEQTKIASDYLQDKPDIRVQINNLQKELHKLQNKFGKLREISANKPEEPFKDVDAALVVLKNKKASLTDRFEALKFLANTVTEKTFPTERFKEIEDAIIDFNKEVGAFDVKLLSLGQRLKEQPQWHPDVRQMQEKDYSDMMKAQRTIKENMSGASQVILAKITKDITTATTIDFPSKIKALESVEPEMFEESYLALVTNPQYLVYLKSWTPQNDREIYTENFNQIPELIKDLKNASGKPLKDDDRIDYDTLYKLIYALPHFALQKEIFGKAFGEYLLVLSAKLEN